jgi:hypothetical protein
VDARRINSTIAFQKQVRITVKEYALSCSGDKTPRQDKGSASVQHIFHHDTDLNTVQEALELAWESYSTRFAQYQPQMKSFDGNRVDVRFNIRGFSLKGTLILGPHTIEMNLDVPLPLRLFSGVAKAVIDREIKHWITKVSGPA